MAIEIAATTRKAQGTGASRRLRKTNRVPGIVYGTGEAAMIEIDHNTLYFALRKEAFHASVLSLDLDGKKQDVLLRDFQMHPFRQQVLHIDFQRVDAKKKIHMKMPLHFINADIAPGVKTGGGIISHVLNDLEIACLAADLPAAIEVDLASLDLGHSIHVSDIKLPKGVEVAGHHHASRCRGDGASAARCRGSCGRCRCCRSRICCVNRSRCRNCAAATAKPAADAKK